MVASSSYIIAKSRIAGSILLTALVVTGGIIGSSLGSLDSWWHLPRTSQPTSSHSSRPENGTLLLQVLIETRLKIFARLPSAYSAVSDSAVTVSGPVDLVSSPLVKQTDSSGLVSFELPAAEGYVVNVDDPRFHTTFRLNVTTGTTFVVCRAHRLAYHVSFAELSDKRSAGWVTGDQSDFIMIDTSRVNAAFHGGVFLEVERTPALSSPSAVFDTGSGVEQIPVVVTETLVRGNTTMLMVQPIGGARVDGLLRTLIVTYVPTIEFAG